METLFYVVKHIYTQYTDNKCVILNFTLPQPLNTLNIVNQQEHFPVKFTIFEKCVCKNIRSLP